MENRWAIRRSSGLRHRVTPSRRSVARLTLVAAILALAGCARGPKPGDVAVCLAAAPALIDQGVASTEGAVVEPVSRSGVRGVVIRVLAPWDGAALPLTCRFDPTVEPGDVEGLIGVVPPGGRQLTVRQVASLRAWLRIDAPAYAPAATLAPSAEPILGAFGYGAQALVNGLVRGSLYALTAAGYALVFSLLEIVNFAFGEMFTLGAYVAILVFAGATQSGVLSPLSGWTAGLACLAAVGAMVPWGFAIERVVYRPLRAAGRLFPMVSAIGLSILLQNFIHLSQGARPKFLAALALGSLEIATPDGGGVIRVPLAQLGGIVLGLALGVAVWRLSVATRFGREQRALAQDRVMAALMGVDADRVIGRTFMLGAALAGVSGVAALVIYGEADPVMGVPLGFKALSGAVLGGMGSLGGALIGGLLIGLVEAAWSAYAEPSYRDAVIFALLILVLLFRPRGLFGWSDRTSS